MAGLGNPVPGFSRPGVSKMMERESGASRNWAGAQADTLQGSGVAVRVSTGGAGRRYVTKALTSIFHLRQIPKSRGREVAAGKASNSSGDDFASLAAN